MSRPRKGRTRAALVATLAAAVFGVLPAVGQAQAFAPLDSPGPAIRVSQADLDRAVNCTSGVDAAQRTPVLLVHGTGATADDNWRWTYVPALSRLGVPWCIVDLPDRGTTDIQRSGELLVGVIRDLHRRAGRKISILGHSQGAIVPRWALRFWPDTRGMVDDVISLAGTHHGTRVFTDQCATSPCPVATLQQRHVSGFVRALNSRAETFAGISYTSVFTRTDEIATPNADATGTSSLRGGDGRITNVAIQDVCPLAVSEHLLVGFTDPTAHALAVDALAHDGPADPGRVDRGVCSRLFHPAINQATFLRDFLGAVDSAARYGPRTAREEPGLECYVFGTCPPGAQAQPTSSATARTCTSRRRFTTHLRLLRSPRATLGGKRVRVRRSGKALAVTVDLRGRGPGVVTLRVRGRDARGRAVTVTRRYRTCAAR
jgi:triacylglycerol esterase/lipase EstA (alpha/beta hydrolase family)